MNIIARVPTPVTAAQALDSTKRLWPAVFGEQPSNQALALVLALEWILTGQGQRTFNWDIGNVTAGAQWPNDAYRPPWFDYDGGTNVTDRNVQLHQSMLKGQAPAAYRSYTSLDQGTTDFLRTLRKNNGAIVVAAATGNADTFRKQLAALLLPDFSNPQTIDTLEQFRDQFLPLLGEAVPKSDPGPSPALSIGAHKPGISKAAGVAVALGVAAAAVGLFVATVNPPRALLRRAA